MSGLKWRSRRREGTHRRGKHYAWVKTLFLTISHKRNWHLEKSMVRSSRSGRCLSTEVISDPQWYLLSALLLSDWQLLPSKLFRSHHRYVVWLIKFKCQMVYLRRLPWIVCTRCFTECTRHVPVTGVFLWISLEPWKEEVDVSVAHSLWLSSHNNSKVKS